MYIAPMPLHVNVAGWWLTLIMWWQTFQEMLPLQQAIEPIVKLVIYFSSPLNVWWLSTWWRYNYNRDEFWLTAEKVPKTSLGFKIRIV